MRSTVNKNAIRGILDELERTGRVEVPHRGRGRSRYRALDCVPQAAHGQDARRERVRPVPALALWVIAVTAAVAAGVAAAAAIAVAIAAWIHTGASLYLVYICFSALLEAVAWRVLLWAVPMRAALLEKRPSRSAVDLLQRGEEALRLRCTAAVRARCRNMTDAWWIALLAALLSIGFFAWYEAHGLTLAFNDARSRELIARRVILSRTPGLAQFGATWLPLPSMLMLPLIWNTTLLRDGLAGSLPSMLAYVVAAVYIYRLAHLLTSSRGAGWVAAGALMLNPSLLYMQGTPMSETGSLATLVAGIYYLLRVSQTNHAADIVKCAAAVAAGTLIRYENWLLAITVLPILALAARRRQGYALAEAWTILYAALAFAGCAAWILYNTVIFRDPLLSFFYGQSSHSYYANTPSQLLPARHHPVFAFALYGLTVAKTVGWALVLMAAVGLLAFIWRSRLRLSAWPAYLTAIPFGFYWLVLYRGANNESLPELGLGPYYNIRFGLAMIPAVALFCGVLTTFGRRSLRRGAVIVALTVITVSGIVGLALQTPFVLREAVDGYGGDTRQTSETEARWIGARYRGGNILCTYINDPSLMFYLLAKYDLPDRAFITDANGSQFTDALAHPERSVRWIVMSAKGGNADDRLSSTLHHRKDWRRYFILRETFAAHRLHGRSYGATEVYERRMPPVSA